MFIPVSFLFVWCSCCLKITLQTSVSLSSVDAEYYAMGDSTKEAISLRDVLGEVDYHLTDDKRSRAVQIRAVDNASVIELSRNPVFHTP